VVTPAGNVLAGFVFDPGGTGWCEIRSSSSEATALLSSNSLKDMVDCGVTSQDCPIQPCTVSPTAAVNPNAGPDLQKVLSSAEICVAELTRKFVGPCPIGKRANIEAEAFCTALGVGRRVVASYMLGAAKGTLGYMYCSLWTCPQLNEQCETLPLIALARGKGADARQLPLKSKCASLVGVVVILLIPLAC